MIENARPLETIVVVAIAVQMISVYTPVSAGPSPRAMMMLVAKPALAPIPAVSALKSVLRAMRLGRSASVTR
jgi:hypothetical protein